MPPTPRAPTIGQDIARPKLANGFMVADDGAKLPMRIWMPRGLGNRPAPVEGVIVAVHGFNDYSEAFEMPAEIWARNGIVTMAYDQRGFGANVDAGRWPGAEAMCRDLAAALRLARQRFPDEPVYLLGESMGGAVVLDTAVGPGTVQGAEARRHHPRRPGRLGAQHHAADQPRRALGRRPADPGRELHRRRAGRGRLRQLPDPAPVGSRSALHQGDPGGSTRSTVWPI
ncbi:MAG: alpha/beta fold hydrolase [Aliidongia sp.]